MNRAGAIGAIAGVAMVVVLSAAAYLGQTEPTEPSPADWNGELVWINLLQADSVGHHTHMEQSRMVFGLAAQELNEYLEERQASWRVEPGVYRFDQDPKEALERIYADGMAHLEDLEGGPRDYPFQTFVVGPATSSAVEQILDYETNDILLISHSSTAPSLGIPDNIFRLAPDDTKQAKAVARAIADAGIAAVVPIYLDNIWGAELYSETSVALDAAGVVMDEGVRYGPGESAFAEHVQALSERVRQYTGGGYSAEEVAVLVISYEEVVDILGHSSAYDNLAAVMWFGSDSSAHSASITGDSAALSFAENVGLISPLFHVLHNEKTMRIDDFLLRETGSVPDNTIYSLYDAVWLHGLAIEEARTLDIGVLLHVMPRVAEDYDGAIGTIVFNDAGDLAVSNYELFWIRNGAWESYGIYSGVDDSIARSP